MPCQALPVLSDRNHLAAGVVGAFGGSGGGEDGDEEHDVHEHPHPFVGSGGGHEPRRAEGGERKVRKGEVCEGS